MTKNTDTSMLALLANEVGYDPIEDRLRQNIRATIEALFEEELAAFIGRCRYGRGGTAKKGCSTDTWDTHVALFRDGLAA